MLRMFRNSAAVIVASATLATPLMAQTTAPAAPAAPVVTPQPAAPVAQSAAPAATAPVPQALSDLGIADATAMPDRKGRQRVQGILPNGTAYRAKLNPEGQLRFLGVTEESAMLPEDVTRRLIPEPARVAPIFTEFASVKGVMLGEDHVMVLGADAQGQAVRAAFSTDGVLQRFGRGDGGGRGKDRGMGYGKDGKDRDDHSKKKRHGDGPNDGPNGGSGRDNVALDDAAIQSILTEGGYTQIGGISRDGRRTEADATNPEGEAVRVTINPRGIVVRELAR